MLSQGTASGRIVAVLHDIVEETPLTLDMLRELGYPDEILDAIDAITRRPNETYRAYIQRLAGNALARAIKQADIGDNLGRMPETPEWDSLRQRYRAANKVLTTAALPS